jgi:hypothetical protein
MRSVCGVCSYFKMAKVSGNGISTWFLYRLFPAEEQLATHNKIYSYYSHKPPGVFYTAHICLMQKWSNLKL